MLIIVDLLFWKWIYSFLLDFVLFPTIENVELWSSRAETLNYLKISHEVLIQKKKISKLAEDFLLTSFSDEKKNFR